MLAFRRRWRAPGMRKRWVVELTEEERAVVEAITRRGKGPARKIAHARALRLAVEGRLTDDEIAAATGTRRSLVERTRKRFVLSGLEVALWDKPRPRPKRHAGRPR